MCKCGVWWRISVVVCMCGVWCQVGVVVGCVVSGWCGGMCGDVIRTSICLNFAGRAAARWGT